MTFLDGTQREGDPDKKREGRKANGDKVTHTSMSGGAWRIDDDDLDEFYKLYCEHLLNHGPLHMTEKSTRIGALRVDLDLKYEGQVTEHLHTQKQVVEFTKSYMAEVKRYLAVPNDVEIYVTEKPEPTYYPSKKSSKSGIHLIVPALKTSRYIEETIRLNLLNRMTDFFPGLPISDDWKKVYDASPLTHTMPWTLLGSKKAEGTPYRIKYIIQWNSENGNITIDEDVPLTTTPALLKKLSIRSSPTEETDMTKEGKEIVEAHNNKEPTAISGGKATQPTRGRQMHRDGNSRGSSPDRTAYIQPLSEAMLKYYSDHVFNLAEKRYKEYAEWISVGQCLKNIHPDLESVWLEFSAQDADQYNFREAMAKWNSFGFRFDGPKLSEGSLRLWSRMDNPDKYAEIEKSNIFRLVDESTMTQTEHDVARVVYSMFRDNFKCVRYGNNVWYQYCGHIWQETDKGIQLQCLLSNKVHKLYLDKELEIGNLMRGLNPCPHKNESDMSCEYCLMSSKKKKYITMQTKLRMFTFKDKVMKECRELFLDETFVDKVDENKNLIAFNNGVFDTLNLEFRDGSPDDYISFSTKIDYDKDKKYFEYACWPEIEKFLSSVLPDTEVRNYFMLHLASSLSGNNAQRFHILTGSGSNGKSMLMNLMTTTMGDYCCKLPITLLTQQRGKSSAASPEMVRLKGKRFATMQEPDEQVPLNTGLMKELTSTEKVTARDLYAGAKAMIDFDVQARLHLACNDKPKINAKDGGTWRRLIVINFTSKFVHNPKAPNEYLIDESLMQKTMSQEWATAFLSYLVHLYKTNNGIRKIDIPKKVQEYSEEYKDENDVIAQYLREMLVKIEGETEQVEPVSKGALTSSFQEWKRTNEIRAGATTQELVKRIEDVYGKYPKGGWIAFRFVSV